MAANSDYWCSDDLADGLDDPYQANISMNKASCRDDCKGGYAFDQSFWKSTIISEWGLVCDKAYLATLGKMVFFAGLAAGTFGAGLISDRYGRKAAIVLMAQLLFGCGILAATMPTFVSFVIIWFLTGMQIN